MSSVIERLDALPVTKLHMLIALLCTVGLAADLMEIAVGNGLTAVFSAAPYHMDAGRLGRLFSSIYLGAIIGTPVIGWAADRWGFKRVLIPAFLWLGLTSTLAAMRVNFYWLVSLRFLAGLSLGALPPLIISFLTGLAPPKYRGMYIFWISGFSFLAAPATIFMIRWLTPLHPFGVEGWRWPFAVAGMLALAVGTAFCSIPESPRWLASKGFHTNAETAFIRFRESGLFAGIATPLTDGSEGAVGHATEGDAETSLSVFAPSRMRRRFVFLALLSFLGPWAYVGFSVITGPSLLHRGYDLSNALLYVGLSTFGPSVSTLIVGLFIDRIERRTSLLLCASLMSFGAVAFFTLEKAAWLLAALVVFGIAVGFFVPLMSTYGAELFPTSRRASVSTGAWAINRVASATVPLLMLPLLAKGGESAVSKIIYTALILLFLILVGFGPRGAAARPVA